MCVLLSAASNLCFPESRHSAVAFQCAAEFLKARGFDGMEFYCDGASMKHIGKILQENHIDGVYIVVIPLKEQLLHRNRSIIPCTDNFL